MFGAGAVARLHNVTFERNLPAGHAIDCSAATEHYTADGHFAARVVDAGACHA